MGMAQSLKAHAPACGPGWERIWLGSSAARPATPDLDDLAVAEHRHRVGLAELAQLDSQSGPFAARVLRLKGWVTEPNA